MTSSAPLTIDLLQEIARFVPDDASGRRAETLIKAPDLRVVLVTMRAGAELAEHSAPATITVQPLQGRFVFRTDAAEQEIGPGHLVSVAGKVRHAVHCLEDGAFLLTLAWPGPSPVEDAH
ncbi:MAG: cupin domain-containing protein [Thermomicrobiales bacterium]|nr:cupin domain-containing protein [Thermomicrobiales bacterium]